jgi:hypothetical protein
METLVSGLSSEEPWLWDKTQTLLSPGQHIKVSQSSLGCAAGSSLSHDTLQKTLTDSSQFSQAYKRYAGGGYSDFFLVHFQEGEGSN